VVASYFRNAVLVALIGVALTVAGVAVVSVAAALVVAGVFALVAAFVVLDVRP
jgi:hypothetical protein